MTMPDSQPAATACFLDGRIFNVRGRWVMLDSDLAKVYGVETKRVNEAVKREVARKVERFCPNPVHLDQVAVQRQSNSGNRSRLMPACFRMLLSVPLAT
jgi:hypothetical protein